MNRPMCLTQRGLRQSLDRPCRARPAHLVPGRGGPERRRRPRPDGTGTPSLLTACSRDLPTRAGTAWDSYRWGRGEGPSREACTEPDEHLGTALQRLITKRRLGTPDQLFVGALGLTTVDVAATAPAVRLRPELPLKLHQAPDPGAVGADVRLELGGQLADGGQVDVLTATGWIGRCPSRSHGKDDAAGRFRLWTRGRTPPGGSR
jgi:hypothetical protein